MTPLGYLGSWSQDWLGRIFFKNKIWSLGTPLGTWGPYLKKGSVKYFPNVVFWTSWAPWVSPYPLMLCNWPKNFPRVCVYHEVEFTVINSTRLSSPVDRGKNPNLLVMKWMKIAIVKKRREVSEGADFGPPLSTSGRANIWEIMTFQEKQKTDWSLEFWVYIKINK